MQIYIYNIFNENQLVLFFVKEPWLTQEGKKMIIKETSRWAKQMVIFTTKEISKVKEEMGRVQLQGGQGRPLWGGDFWVET